LAHAQSESGDLTPILKDEILPQAVAEFQVRQYLVDRIAPVVGRLERRWLSRGVSILVLYLAMFAVIVA
jgi:hypothetical protein